MKERLSASELRTAYSIPYRRESDFLEFKGLRLYMPRSFKATTMMVGNPESPVALCTGWSDPWDVVSSKTVESFSVVAPLREPLGVDIMLHNLLANPQIRAVVLYHRGRFDETEAARRPMEILKTIWANGVDESGLVRGTSHQLFPELVDDGMLEELKKMVADVQLLEFEGKTVEMIAAEVRKGERFSFPPRVRAIPPEFKIPQVERFPSEGVSLQIRERNAFEAWSDFIGLIMRYGHDCALEKGGALVREIPYVRIVLERNPDRFFAIPSWTGELKNVLLTEKELEAYYQKYIRPEDYMREIYPGVWKFVRPPEEKYLYAELIFAFPRPKEVDLAVEFMLKTEGLEAVIKFLENSFPLKDLAKKKIAERVCRDFTFSPEKKSDILLEIFCPPTNQLADKIRRIKEMPDDADKTIILWDPRTHGMQDRGRPCWIELNFLVREGKIHTKAVFRSHDIAKGWLFNAYGIWRLWQDVCQETGYEMGKMTIESESAHVYKGDETWVREFWEERFNESRPKLVFDSERADPRGNLVISVVNDEITCVLVSPDGRPLAEIRGRTAKRIMAEINRRDWISQIDHALDIGSELAKAGICRKLKIPYQQDKPFSWEDAISSTEV